MPEFHYQFFPALHIVVCGPLNSETVDLFSQDVIQKMMETPESCVVMDLNGLQMINSIGLGAIIRIWKKAKEMDKSLQIVANQRVTHILRIARLHQIIDIQTIQPDKYN